MPVPTGPSIRPVHARPLLLVALTAALAGWIVGCSTAPTSSTPPATAAPVASATPAADPSGDGAAHVVALDGATGTDISVDIVDASGLLVSAETGAPGDGASVAPYELVVTNDDPTTLRLVWAGGPCDAVDSLSIDASARSILLVEPECPGDAVAFDRVLLLHFASPVPAADVRASLQDGLDTAG